MIAVVDAAVLPVSAAFHAGIATTRLAARTAKAHVAGMSKYTIVARVRQPGFKVEVEGRDGARNTVLGFATEQEAAEWVEASRRHEQMTPLGSAG